MNVQSIQRVFQLLELLASSDCEVSIRELSAVTNLPATTVHRLLNSMVTLSYVDRSPNHRYSLNSRLSRLGKGADDPTNSGDPLQLVLEPSPASSQLPAAAQPSVSDKKKLWCEEMDTANSCEELAVGSYVEARRNEQVQYCGVIDDILPAHDLFWVLDLCTGGRKLLDFADFDEIVAERHTADASETPDHTKVTTTLKSQSKRPRKAGPGLVTISNNPRRPRNTSTGA